MLKHFFPALIAGLVSCGLFLLVVGFGLGFIFMFLPTLPLFWVGLGRGESVCRMALLIAFVAIAAAGNLATAIIFFLVFGLPSWFMVRLALQYKEVGGSREWFPIGRIILHLSVYATLLLALISFYYWHDNGGLPQMLSDNIHATFSDMATEYGEIIDLMAGAWSFLIFPITLWLWGMTLYAHGWFVNRMLKRTNKQIRPDFSIEPFHIANWMLTLLAICALASLIGSPQMSFLGKGTLITLLLPYFFLGAATLHKNLRSIPNYRFILFFVYFMVFSLFWPALLIAAIGFFEQIKHLSAGKTSSKS